MPQLIEVTTTAKAPKRRPDLRFYTTSRLDAYRRDGLLITTPIQTLLDLAATRSANVLEARLQRALYLQLVHPDQLRQQQGRGAAMLRAVAAEAAPTRNDFERRMLRLLREPQPAHRPGQRSSRPLPPRLPLAAAPGRG